MAKEGTYDLVIIAIILGAVIFIGEKIFSVFAPGTATNNFIQNAAAGTVTQSQQNDLIDQETAALIKAGADPVTARNEAITDVTTAISTGTVSYGSALWDVIKNPIGALQSIF